MAPRALVVEDDHAIAHLLQAVLAHESIGCDHAPDGAVALWKIARNEYDAILLDLLVPVADGLQILRTVRDSRPEVLPRVIVVTAANESAWRGCEEISLVHCLMRKPIDIGELVGHVWSCVGTQKRQA